WRGSGLHGLVGSESVRTGDHCAIGGRPLSCAWDSRPPLFAAERLTSHPWHCSSRESWGGHVRILVYPHDMAIGGSQLNAVDLAAAVHDRGHWVGVIGQPGSLQSHIAERGLEFIELPRPGRRPSPRVIGAIRKVAEDRNIDVIHGYEWPPALEAAIASRGCRTTAVATVLSMSVAPFIPYDLPLLVGT